MHLPYLIPRMKLKDTQILNSSIAQQYFFNFFISQKNSINQFFYWQNNYVQYIQSHNNNSSSYGHFPVYTSASSRYFQDMNLVFECSEEGGAIYLGNLEAASNVEYLKRHNIGAVLTVAGGTGLRYNIHDIPMHEIINADDALYQDLSQYFSRMINFIENARQRTNILIHCYAGISRSVTALVAYIMQKKGWAYERTLSFVRSKRSIANPNPSFVRQLKKYEGQLKLYSRGLSSSNSHSDILFGHSTTPTGANRTRQVIDELFDTPSKRASSSYGSRNVVQNSYQTSYPQAKSHINSIYSTSSSMSTTLTSQQQPSISRVLFNTPQNYTPSYAKYTTTPSPIFSSANKNNLYLSRVASQTHSRPFYSKMIY
ncbi:hypothetical protein ABPG72_010579 [Tetrahymena utriculariae]